MVALVPVSDAAERLDVSRRRVQALIEEGRLRAQRVGRQWVVPASELRVVANTLQAGPGRPLSPVGAWSAIARLGGSSISRDDLDQLRRRVRPRAEHRYWFVHAGVLDELQVDHRVVLSGRLAASAAAAVDGGGVMDLYVKSSDEHALMDDFAASEVLEAENVRAHVVADAAWPFAPGERVAGPWVAWLDLADVLDRAADTVLDRLVGGRLRA